jgi:hypothetical protein
MTKVAVHQRWRSHSKTRRAKWGLHRRGRHDLGGLHVDDTVVAKTCDRLTAPCVQRDQQTVTGTEDNLWACVGVSWPVLQAARGGLGAAWQLIRPDLFSGFRLEGHDTSIRCAQVQQSAHHQRCRLGLAESTTAAPKRTCGFGGSLSGLSAGRRLYWCLVQRCRTHVVGPRHFELRDVRRIDLRERRVAHAARIVAIGGPIAGLCSCCGADRSQQGGGGNQISRAAVDRACTHAFN